MEDGSDFNKISELLIVKDATEQAISILQELSSKKM